MPTLAQLRELQAIAQEGLTYSRDPFDLTRFARLLAVMDKAQHPHPPDLWAVYKLFVQCDLTGTGSAAHAENLETLDSAFFPADALPPLSLPRNLPDQVRRVVALARDPHSAVFCD